MSIHWKWEAARHSTEAAHSSHHLAQDIADINTAHAAHASTEVESSLAALVDWIAALIIDSSFMLISKNIISFLDLAELCLSESPHHRISGISIWVPLCTNSFVFSIVVISCGVYVSVHFQNGIIILSQERPSLLLTIFDEIGKLLILLDYHSECIFFFCFHKHLIFIVDLSSSSVGLFIQLIQKCGAREFSQGSFILVQLIESHTFVGQSLSCHKLRS